MIDLQLSFKRLRGNYLPANYQYLVSSWIYKVIGRSDKGHSTFLHEKGFRAEGRTFKLFTFSQLDVRPYQMEGNAIRLLGDEMKLTVRFLVDASLQHFIQGLFLHQHVGLGQHGQTPTDFEVTSVEAQNQSVFKPLVRYQCLSPICVSQLRGDGTTEYLTPASKNFGELLVNNLVKKEKAYASIVKSVGGVTDEPRPAFKFTLLNEPRKKGVHIKENSDSHTQLIGYLFHFELLAPPELHEIGYYAGFGEKNSMGFGCVASRV